MTETAIEVTPLDSLICQEVHAPEWFYDRDVSGKHATRKTEYGGRGEACVDCQRAAVVVADWLLTRSAATAEAIELVPTAPAYEAPFELIVAEAVVIALAREARPCDSDA